MKEKTDFVSRGELAARAATQEWIRQALRESFLQALKQAWKVRHDNRDLETEKSGIRVEVSLSGVNACFAFVERVSKAWQKKLKEEQHERVARWIEEVYQEGKSSLWADQLSEANGDSDEHLNTTLSNEQVLPQQFEKKSPSDENLSVSNTGDDEEIDGGGDDEGEASSASIEEHQNHGSHPNVYCRLRALGRRRNIDCPVLPIPDGLQELKEFTQNQPTYWPMTNDIIDKACSDMSRRMRARDKHGSGGSGNDSGAKSYTKKTVRFKVLPKSVWETKQQQERNQTESNEPISDGDENIKSSERQTASSSVESALLASMKKKKSENISQTIIQTSRKKSRISERHEASRVPFDVADGVIHINLSLQDKNVLDGLLILDDEDGDTNDSQPTTTSMSETPLGLFGGLKHVGETNHLVQNPGTGSGRTFMAKDSDKITRRREKASVQERLDPNRIQIGRTEDPSKRKSKILRTEDWFDDQMKFFELDLGWCLLEIPTEKNEKRLCAFSSMEICLEDSDS